MHLDWRQIGKRSALPLTCNRAMSLMFKITQNTIHHFSLAEILLMAVMNEVEAKQKAPAAASGSENGQVGVRR